MLGAGLIAAGFTDRAVPSSGEPARGGVGDRLSAVPAAIADDSRRAVHPPPAGRGIVSVLCLQFRVL